MKRSCFCGFLVYLLIYLFLKQNRHGIGGQRAPFNLRFGGIFLLLLSLTEAVPSSPLFPPSCGRQRLSTFLPRSESVLCILSLPGHPDPPSIYSQYEFWEVLENPDTQVCTHKLVPVIIGCVGCELYGTVRLSMFRREKYNECNEKPNLLQTQY